MHTCLRCCMQGCCQDSAFTAMQALSYTFRHPAVVGRGHRACSTGVCSILLTVQEMLGGATVQNNTALRRHAMSRGAWTTVVQLLHPLQCTGGFLQPSSAQDLQRRGWFGQLQRRGLPAFPQGRRSLCTDKHELLPSTAAPAPTWKDHAPSTRCLLKIDGKTLITLRTSGARCQPWASGMETASTDPAQSQLWPQATCQKWLSAPRQGVSGFGCLELQWTQSGFATFVPAFLFF